MPYDTLGVTGYKAIDISYTGGYWGGLERFGDSSLLDGSVESGSWWYAVGVIDPENGRGIPGPPNNWVEQVQQRCYICEPDCIPSV
jgi:hypothetical protein